MSTEGVTDTEMSSNLRFNTPTIIIVETLASDNPITEVVPVVIEI